MILRIHHCVVVDAVSGTVASLSTPYIIQCIRTVEYEKVYRHLHLAQSHEWRKYFLGILLGYRIVKRRDCKLIKCAL